MGIGACRILLMGLGVLSANLSIAQSALAQVPKGTTATVTYFEPVVETVIDPLTGVSTTQTTRETLFDLKHEDMPQFSLCTFEPIVINGHARFTIRTSTSGDRTTMQAHQESAGTGYGEATGWRYAYNMTSQSSSRTSSTGEDQMVVSHDNLIRQGETTTTVGGDDQYMRTNLHMSFIGGWAVPRVDKFEIGCR